jgi:hypothetical protein
VDDKTLHPQSNGWHGNVDVKTQHEFVKSLPESEAMACPNAGTGRAIDAAEWVKWANKKMGYNVRVWEIGNELGGSWEAGTALPFGKGQLTGEMYTKRYNEMAQAMRQVDPTIKIGSCPFVEEALRDGGKNVDFVSIHSYPGSATLSESQMFADIKPMVERDTGQVKRWIHQYQPEREKDIEIAYTEWNLSGGLNNGKLFSGLWSSIFLGELASNGVSMATQWDCFTDLLESLDDGKRFVPKPEYYALWLWNNYMGDRLIPAKSSDPSVYTYASRSDAAATVMLVNTDKEREAVAKVQLSGMSPAGAGEVARITSREYFYDTVENRVRWSTGPRIEPLPTGKTFTVRLAPFSVAYVRIPTEATPALSPMAQKALAAKPEPLGTPQLRFVFPSEIYAGDRVNGEVIAAVSGADAPYRTGLAPATLSSNGSAVFDRKQAQLTEAVGHFTMTAPEPGTLTLTAQSGSLKVTRQVLVKASTPRPVVFWDFSNPPVTDRDSFKSDYGLKEDLTQRANRAVARVDLEVKDAVGDNGHGLIKVDRLPEKTVLQKENIRGVIADVRTSPDFACDDPNAVITVVMQSPANWWMKIGSIPLQEAKDWKTYQLAVTNEDYFKALPSAMNIIFVLQSKTPAKGSIYFDRIGFLVR